MSMQAADATPREDNGEIPRSTVVAAKDKTRKSDHNGQDTEGREGDAPLESRAPRLLRAKE